MIRKLVILLLMVLIQVKVSAQDELEKLMAGYEPRPNNVTLATFKTTRIINFQSVEVCGKRTLDFRISHRFGTMNGGVDNFWGLDGGASIRLGLEYSYDGRFMVGLGRSSYQKMLDGFMKYRLLRQTDDQSMPLSMTLFSGAYCRTGKSPLRTEWFNPNSSFYSRLSFCHQMIISRKFSNTFSLQVAPWFVHDNLVEGIRDQNDMFGLSAAFRYKFTRRMAVTAEYAARLNKYTDRFYYNSLGVGLEIETGGHVFQMHITNSFGLTENQFLPYTDSKWGNAGIRLGFNISRVFTL